MYSLVCVSVFVRVPSQLHHQTLTLTLKLDFHLRNSLNLSEQRYSATCTRLQVATLLLYLLTVLETSILLFGLVINWELKRGQLLHGIGPGPEF